jgi:hypothetical protein
MTLTALTPKTMYGWLGLIIAGGALLYHKSLSSVGLVLGLGVGLYLYFYMDQSAA